MNSKVPKGHRVAYHVRHWSEIAGFLALNAGCAPTAFGMVFAKHFFIDNNTSKSPHGAVGRAQLAQQWMASHQR
jgi:hypothetical protein